MTIIVLALAGCYNYSHSPVSSPPGFPPPPQQTPVGAQVCGGMSGAVCTGRNSYCHFTPEAQCGVADQLGTCRTKPDVCIEIYAPVCGCDGRTYTSECVANREGVSTAYTGQCRG